MGSSSTSLYQNIGMVTNHEAAKQTKLYKQFYMLCLSWKIAVFQIKKQKETNCDYMKCLEQTGDYIINHKWPHASLNSM